MREQELEGAQGQSQLVGKISQEITVFLGSICQRVIVTNLGIVVVFRISVTTLAVLQAMANRVIVVTLDALDLVFFQQGENAIRIRAETSQVTKTVNSIDATL